MSALLVFIFVFSVRAIATQGPAVSANCTAQAANEPALGKQDYSHLMVNEADAASAYAATYTDIRRWANRAYWSPTILSYVVLRDGREVSLPERFLKNLRREIELALARGYADHVFYPDMGHAHLLIPDAWDTKPNHQVQSLDDFLDRPELRFLFHTAELYVLRKNLTGPLVGDTWWNWRYYSRNLVGNNQDAESLHIEFAKDQVYNTVRAFPGYQEMTIVDISANQNGCFSFVQNSQTVNFDLHIE